MATIERNTQQLQSENIREKIARRAYEVYESRGCQEGHDLDDWLKAENEVRSEMQRPNVKSVAQSSEQVLPSSSAKRSSERRAS